MNWFKIAQNRPVVTFDFDGTLTRQMPEKDDTMDSGHLWVDSMEPNYKNMAKLIEEAKNNDVYIVTARQTKYEQSNIGIYNTTSDTSTGVYDFLQAYGLLPYVKDVIFAGDRSANADKGTILKELGSIRHYDDNDDHLEEARYVGIEGVKVPEMDFDDHNDYEQNIQQYEDEYKRLKGDELV